jgi:polysaccharide export outer membrane protein
VALRVDQYRSQFVRLLGQVYAPGDYYIDATPMSLAEAITRAGGLLDDADLSLIVLTRNGRTENLDLRQLYALGLQPQDLMLRHGDVLRFAPTE